MKNLVLIGGGHTHAITLRLFGLDPLSCVCLTLITDVLSAPYSGMLPGHIAGFYTFDECHINLADLARFAQARLIVDEVIGLDLPKKQVLCKNHSPIAFDWLSINIGSKPDNTTILGGSEYVIPAKPVPQFLAYWNQFLDLLQSPQEVFFERPFRLGIIGGGAGGVELALNMQAKLHQLLSARGLSPSHIEIHLFHRQLNLLTGYPAFIGLRFRQLLIRRGINLHLGETAQQITVFSHHDSNLFEKLIRCESGLTVICNLIFLVTNASAPSWLRESGLDTDNRGFILVDNTLQSVSHPGIFATGDIAEIVNYSRPKAGVFAVRQGKPLFENLRLIASGKTPRPFYPQKFYLALIGTGKLQALAAWGKYCIGPSFLLWCWKNWIDRQFMNQFAKLLEKDRKISDHRVD
jgi:pyridine nucleotide-disulfide oxidoreductase family protein